MTWMDITLTFSRKRYAPSTF